MNEYAFFTLREKPEIKRKAAEWFHGKWSAPAEAYLECMGAYLGGETEYGWYLCLCGGEIAGRLLNFAVEDLRSKGVSPVYLVTDHVGFYERYGWEFFCTAQCDDGNESRVNIHR